MGFIQQVSCFELRRSTYVLADVHDTHHNYNPRALEFTNNYPANQSHKNNFHQKPESFISKTKATKGTE
jgi:hypothetical protein